VLVRKCWWIHDAKTYSDNTDEGSIAKSRFILPNDAMFRASYASWRLMRR
jgi:hypothetical protein